MTFQPHASMSRATVHGGDPASPAPARRHRLPSAWLGAAAAAGVLGMSGVFGVSAANAASTTTNYTPTGASIANPERGFYHHKGDCDKDDFTTSTLQSYRTGEHVNLVMCIFFLEEFKTSPISQAQLDRFQQQADTVRAAGLKMILRFAYSDDEEETDASPSQVQAHLTQLAPYLRSNADVIAVVQSGFVGAWGEGYFTKHFGGNGVVSPANWADRKAVVDRLLTILPATIKVQVRTPLMKTQMYGAAPATESDAAARRAVARVGHHNDCFLASRTDFGTYRDPAAEYPYLAADTKFAPMGGETCAVNPPRSECPTALQELSMFHYSYLNSDYKPEVLASWGNGGCMAEVQRRLGYRFSLLSVTAPTTATRGAALPFRMTVRNDGWAGAFTQRPVRLVLRNTVTRRIHKLSLTSTRTWDAGATVTVNPAQLIIPSTLPVGSYDLLLSIADPTGSIANRPEYAVQLANEGGLWEPDTGWNKLLRRLRVQ